MAQSNIENILQENLRPIKFQQEFARSFAFSPVHIGIFVSIILCRIQGIIPRELSLLPLWMSTMIYFVIVGAYFMFVLLVYPHTMRFCAVKRIPFVYHCYFVYLLFTTSVFLLFGNILNQYSVNPTHIMFINRVAFALPFVMLMAYIMGDDASISLFGNTNFYPAWRRYKPPLHSILQKVSPELVAPIRYIQAKSPYVNIVTTKGTERMRMTFLEALEKIQYDEGYQIHRSCWVAKSEISSIKFVNGNPKVVLKDRTVLNANRKFAKFAKRNFDVIRDDQG